MADAESSGAGGGIPRARAARWPVVVVAMVAAVVPILYAVYTHHVWEDYLITFRFSQNLAEGRGLVYNPPERVHGFTSPIGVLGPAFFHVITGQGDYHRALWCWRVVCAIAFAAAAALAFDAVRRSTRGRVWPAVLTAALLVLDPKSVGYSANGQEQAFMLLCAAAGVWLSLDAPSRRWKWWAVVFAGFQWTRPDGVLYCLAFVAANVAFPLEPRRRVLVSLAKAAGLAIVLYLPWLIFTTAYYGSPIPHTVIAKTGLKSPAPTTASPAAFVKALVLRAAASTGPGLPDLSEWPPHVRVFGTVAGVFGLLYWLVPGGNRAGRVASLCFLLVAPYFAAITIDYAWYYPPFALLALVAFAAGVPAFAARFTPALASVAGVLLVGAVVGRAMFSADYWRLMKIQQAVIETGNRQQIGLYLREHAKPGDTVYLEPLGYVGYFSNAHMHDYPGLVSPTVSRMVRHEGATFDGVVPLLKPDWAVLRWQEKLILSHQPYFAENYEEVRWFDVSKQVHKYTGGESIPGRGYIEYDSTYIVFRKKAAAAPPAVTTAPAGGSD